MSTIKKQSLARPIMKTSGSQVYMATQKSIFDNMEVMDKVSLPFLGEYEVAPQDFFGKIVLANFSTNTPYQLVRRQYIVELLTIPVWIYQPVELCDDIFCHYANVLPQLRSGSRGGVEGVTTPL